MATACGTPTHDVAVRIAKTYARTHGYTSKVACTSGFGFFKVRSPDYVCTVHHTPTDCDQIEVKRSGRPAAWHVRVYRSNVDCVLPA
ncbi:MAG TPA: hypothetical protein VFW85_07235 [Gaiellaceae bacterium]|nr:hypothetical protein [Gaiellaceae bacterium]